MTGPGTNAYFIGAPGSDDWALLDPGPDHADHVQALLAAAPGPHHPHAGHPHPQGPFAGGGGDRRGHRRATSGRVAAHPDGRTPTSSRPMCWATATC